MMSESYIKADVPHEEFKLKLYRVRTQVRIAFGVTWLLLLEFLCFFRDLFLCNKEKNVSGQVCLVTGGANGLGRCIAMEFASKGCHIAIADIIDSSNTVNEIKEKFKVECEGFKCDISNVTSIQKMKCDIEKSIGPVDILVNNAAMILCDRFKNCTIEQISRCVDVNLTSNIKLIKIFLPQMIQNKRGKIVSISSMGAKVTMPILSVYSATKYGVDGFMESMFDELCIDGYDDCIKLTTVYPYFMYTSKDVECILNKLKDPYPRNLPEKVAQITVKGVLEGKRKIYILPTYFYLFIQKMPDRVIKYLKENITPRKDFGLGDSETKNIVV